MVDFNDYKYSETPTSKIDKLAARIDGNSEKGGDSSGKIDNAREKSIFLEGAKNLVKNNKLDKETFKNIFGAEFSDDLKYDGAVDDSTPEVEEESSTTTTTGSDSGYTLTAQDKETLKKRGTNRGSDLYNYLNGGNGWSLLGGFDFWGGFGSGYSDGHERANNLFGRLKKSDPLEMAYVIKSFNEKASAKNQESICEFIMNEAWSGEEEAVRVIAEQVLDMCDKLAAKNKWKENPAIDEGYELLKEIKDNPDIVDDQYDEDELTMKSIDEFVAKITDLYIKEFG